MIRDESKFVCALIADEDAGQGAGSDNEPGRDEDAGQGAGSDAEPGTGADAGLVRALYLHLPFCVRKCAYCDFASWPTDRNDPLM